ncbi:type I polyketide synthase [Actinophytocola algeriensis]|nr:type I polyketide synthase [Actinophytocola algeriensis]
MQPQRNERTGNLPVAIVGVACRLPGAPNVQEFWKLLTAARHTIAEPSPERRRTFLGQIPERGGFLDSIDSFDASFFGLSPFEALRIDPHHRLMLETVWEALEDAGLPPDQLAGSRTGVYTSWFGGHYWQLLHEAGVSDVHAYLGSHRSSAPAGRIAHLLDLRGPAMGTEAHCASSLVAVHHARRALEAGEIEMAIVGGVNLLLRPDERAGLADAGIISPTYRSRFGDEDADGYVPAEGAVTLILKPLDDAIAAGDPVYATILGSGVCSNGRQALSASSTGVAGQEDLLRMTLREAGLSPADIDYVEAHGPGTAQGDVVELTALGNVLGEGREAGRPCLVGSVKSNIGHAEAAAGMAGLLKTALALRYRTIPATLHVRQPISLLAADDAPIELARYTQAWPDRGVPAVAGVTALGMFGIGAHVILGEAPPVTPPSRPAVDRAMLLPLSAEDPAALAGLASAYADTLAMARNPEDVCYSAGAHRTHLSHRVAVAAADRRTLVERLRRLADRRRIGEVAGKPARVVFVFSGQGSQWHGMARELLETEPVFARSMRECDELIRAEGGWSLLDLLAGETPMTGDDRVQPALWAIQVGLARMWRHWGIEPDLVIGHSMGEIAAATTAGALTPRDGAAVICRRSVLVGTLREPGAMVAVAIGEHEANEAIGEYADQVSVAVVNSGWSTVLAGTQDAVDTVVAPLRERGVHCRPVRTNYASHSPNVEPLRDGLVSALADVCPRAGDVPMHSTALDREVRGDELDAQYWMSNLREPVRFASAVRAVLADEVPTLFVEMSPHPLLVPAIDDEIAACEADFATAVPSLVRDVPAGESMRVALGAAYERGRVPDWSRLYDSGQRVSLPTYPWQRTRFWFSPPAQAPVRQVQSPPPPQEPPPQEPPTLVPPTLVPPTLVAPALVAPALAEQIASRAAEILAAPIDSIDTAAPLHVAGMDSVLAARLCLRLKQELDLRVPYADLIEDRSLLEVAEELCGKAARAESAELADLSLAH